MASLADLANNLSNFQYYSGLGNFTANNLPADSGQAIVKQPGEQWSLGLSDTLTPFGVVTTVNRTIADVERVSSFLYTKAQGPQFLIKQTALQFENVNIEHDGEALSKKPTSGQGFFTNIGNRISNFANSISNDYGPTRIYNPLGINTLAEVAVVASGLRFTKHGLLPGISDTKAYTNYILSKDASGNNRLTNLVGKLSQNGSGRVNVIAEYKGGPGSIYGIGKTTINRSSYDGRSNVMDLSGADLVDSKSKSTMFSINTLVNLGVDNTITLGSGNTSKKYTLNEQQDFRAVKNALNVSNSSASGRILASTDYAKYNTNTRIGTSRARTPLEYNANYTKDAPLASDRVNKLSLFYGSSVRAAIDAHTKDINGIQLDEVNTRDMVKFRIKSYDNDVTDGSGVYMIFRAYLNNIKRNMQSKWNPYNYVGRGESFYLYDGFTESISFQFTLAASSRSEMKPMYQKLNYLMSTLTPDYNKQNRMRGNITELTIGDFVLYQPGIITNLDIIVDDDYNWEIAMDEPESGGDVDMHELPQILKCSMTFIPIYNFLPRKSAEAPFIGIDNREANRERKEWLKGNNTKLKSTLYQTKDSMDINGNNSNIGSNPVTTNLQNMV